MKPGFLIGMTWQLAVSLAVWAQAGKPVLEHDLQAPNRAQLEARAQEIFALSEAELLALVPVQTPFITSDCPACGHGHYTRGLDRNLWKFELPNRISCVKCGTGFPNEKFPLNDKATFLNTLGEQVEIAFHRDATGQRFALPGAIQSWQNGWLTQQLEALGKLYRLTGDERFARRVVLVLDRYAQLFPHYLVKDFLTDKVDIPGSSITQKSRYVYLSTGGPWMRDGRRFAEKPSEPAASNERTNTPYGWTQSRWGWGRWGDEFPAELLVAYDLVQSSGEFQKLSAELRVDVRQRIADGLFGKAVAYLQEFPFFFHLNNNASGQIADIIRAGRVLGRPEWVHFGYRWSREVLEKYAFSRDGAFAESPGYLYVFLASQETNFTVLNAYSDPPGFVGQDGLHLENLGSSGSLAFLQKARAAVESICFPNGSLLPLGDNRHDEFVAPLAWPNTGRTALERSRSVLLPGYGHAILGDGRGDRQVQAHLQFSKFTDVVHTHRDGLSLMLWAFGSEFFTDIGYHKSKYRGYASTTLSHNTVVIDRTAQQGREPKGSVLLYEPNLPGVSLVQVQDKGAYEGTATRYRRTLLLNTRDVDAPYLVDVFEVCGGQTHDYALHGPTIFDSVAETTLPLNALAGERPLLGPEEKWTDDTGKCAYGVFTNVRSGPANGDFAVTLQLVKPFQLSEYHPNARYKAGASFHYAADPTFYREQRQLGVRTHFPGGSGERHLYLAESPSLLRSGLGGSALTEKLKRPSLLLRRQGADGLSSIFVAVHEPFYGAPKITAVKRLAATTAADSSVILRIESASGVDTVLLSLEGPQTIRTDSTTMTGIAALLANPRDGEPTAFLFGGSELRAGTLQTTAAVTGHRGEIQSVTSQWDGAADNTFITSAPLPGGDVLRGTWMFVTFGESSATEAFEIDHVTASAGRTLVFLRDDPGLRMKGGTTSEIFFPRRQFTGKNHFVIHGRATAK
jgi:hypothetical protein